MTYPAYNDRRLREPLPIVPYGWDDVNGILRPVALDASGNLQVTQAAAAAIAGDINAPASNTAAVVTYAAAGAGISHYISGLAWSYSGGSPAGNLKIEDGAGIVIFSVDISAVGMGIINFPVAKKGTANTALIVTLSAGGSGVTGKVNVLNHWTR